MRQKLQFQVVRISPWQFWLAAAFTLALVIVIAVLAAGLLLILVPFVLVVTLIYKIMNPPAAPDAGDPRVIDAQYTVIDEDAERGGKNGDHRR